jgi:hypothetical protein
MEDFDDLSSGNPDEESATLMGQGSKIRIEETFLWMFFHWAGFFLGGSTFVAGTVLYFFPDLPYQGEWSAALYTLGSCGFLTVDVMELFTFTDVFVLTVNISCSVIGSLFYVIGSIGFFPEIYNMTDIVGIWGFILGSFFIGSSQIWKTFRIGKGRNDSFSVSNLLADIDSRTQVGVELNAGFGGWCFFVGTVMYLHGPLEGQWYFDVLCIWTAGSFFFLLGSFFLGYRHWIMHV